MVNCSYCDKEIDRNVFCSASCKTMFHRKKGPQTKAKEVKEDKLSPEQSVERRFEEKELKLCKHGFAIGLCKYGCKK